MVHRPSDSRLLSNLLSHEKDYSKHLNSLIDTSHASLASFSAYASASAPPVSNTILAVAGSLAGSDDALRKYTAAVDEWREHLKDLKALEEEVGNIMRDREILVNRLIKAAKSGKPTRESLLINQPFPSTGSTLSLKSDFSSSSKLTSAQAELQACEAQLAFKERELDSRRSSAIRDGLSIRCKAMVECGWVWGEMGKEGLRALEVLGEEELQASRPLSPPMSSPSTKPLPDPTRPASDLSSLAPSQSASQTNVPPPTHHPAPLLSIPPAHAIGDHHSAFPSHVLARRITEEELGGSSSAEEDDDRDVAVVENPKYATSDNDLIRRFSVRAQTPPRSPTTAVSDTGARTIPAKRERRTSHGFFGSLRGLFNKREPGIVRRASDDDPQLTPKTTRVKEGKWATRTDRNLKRIHRGDHSDDEDDDRPTITPISTFLPPPLPRPVSPSSPSSPGGKRLKKGAGTTRKKKNTAGQDIVDLGPSAESQDTPADGVKRTEEWLGGQSRIAQEGERPKKKTHARSSSHPEPSRQPGGMSSDEDGNATSDSAKVTRRRSTSSKKSSGGRSKSKERGKPVPLVVEGNNPPAVPKLPASVENQTGAQLSRNSSIASAASTLNPGLNSIGKGLPPRRAQSISEDASSPHTKSSATKARRASGTSVGTGEGKQSLMSIVEGVARQNEDERNRSIGGSNTRLGGPGMEIIKAPRSIGRKELEMDEIDLGRSLDASPPVPKVPKAPEPVAHVPKATPSTGGAHVQHSVKPAEQASNAEVKSKSTDGQLVQPKPVAASGLRPIQSPLRSALKNPSRTPSPMPNGLHDVPKVTSPPPTQETVSQPKPASPPLSQDAMANSNTAGSSKQYLAPAAIDDDTASISSYETGNEAFVDAEDGEETEHERNHTPSPPPPPPRDSSPPVINGGSDLSASTASTEVQANVPKRRKSVRVSLQPTFSPTPPAFEEEEDDEAHAPWNGSTPNGGWQTRNGGVNGYADPWEDSSEEDEEYSRAKKLLSRVTGKEKKDSGKHRR